MVISGPVLVKVKESNIDNITAKACQSVRKRLLKTELYIFLFEKGCNIEMQYLYLCCELYCIRETGLSGNRRRIVCGR